jgi:hypothetical protein
MSYFGVPIRNGVPIGLGSIISLFSPKVATPSLAFNFLSGVLDSQITFTRASTGTYFNSAGALTSAAINVPRFDYNPTTLAAQGLLIEEARTNLVLNSATLITQSVTVTAVAHTLSFYGTGTVIISGTGTGTLVGSGAFPTRSTLTFTPTAGVVILTVTGTVTQAQLEVGAFATSYIPTTAAAATRAADIANVSTLTPWFNNVEGTVYFEGQYGAANGFMFSLFGSSTSNRIYENANTLNRIEGGTRVGGVFSNASTSPVLPNANFKSALAYKNADTAISANGGTAVVATPASTALPTVLRFDIGNNSALVGNALNGYVRNITYYPIRLSNAQIKALTV